MSGSTLPLFDEPQVEQQGRTVVLRFGPLPRYTANDRMCWQVETRRKSIIRREGRRQGRACEVKLLRAEVEVVVHPKTKGHYDPSNWAPTAKLLLDGLVDVGVLPGDDFRRVPRVSYVPGEWAADGPRVDLILREVL